MTTTIDTSTGTLTEKEGNDLFLEAYSKLTKEDYKPEIPDPDPVVETPTTTETEEKKEEESAKPVETTPTTPAPSSEKVPTIEELLASVPEDKRQLLQSVLAERDMAEQKFRSHQGRLAAERRRATELEQQLFKLRSGSKAPLDPAVAAQAKADHAKLIAEWGQVVEAEPTLAKAIDALTDAKTESLEAKLRAEQEAREEQGRLQAREATKHQEWDRLVEAVPNAGDILRSPAFQYWKENIAPPAVKNMADQSIDHRDAIHVMQQYHPYAVWLNEQQNKTTQTQVAPSTTSVVADKISEKRAEKVSPVVSGASVTPNLSADNGHQFDDATAERIFQEAYARIKSK